MDIPNTVLEERRNRWRVCRCLLDSPSDLDATTEPLGARHGERPG